MEILEQIIENLDLGEDEKVGELTAKALEQGLTPQVILDDGLIAGMNVIGLKFRNHEVFLPDVLMAAKAMYAGLDLLEPLLLAAGAKSKGKIVLGSVQGDLHDIGKNLVAIMLKGAGFDVVDLGSDVSPAKFIETVEKEQATVLGMSALLTTTMPVMKQVVELAREKGLKDNLKIIVGGAPVSQEYADEIGADSYSFDAANAVDIVKSFIGA
jgi:5-methyltetrahydrofolate--homocysteine methyltransferase